MGNLNHQLPLARTVVFGIVGLFTIINFGLSIHIVHVASRGVVPDWAGLGLATSILTLVALPILFIVPIKRHGALPAFVAVELAVLWLLWILWLATGATIAGLPGLNFCNGGLCSEARALEAFSFLNWLLLMFYSFTLLTLSVIAHQRGRTELVDIILSHLRPLESTDHTETLSTLTQCALVSRQFSVLVRPMIWSRVEIVDSNPRPQFNAAHKLESLDQALRANPFLTNLIKSFSLKTWFYEEVPEERARNPMFAGPRQSVAIPIYKHRSLAFVLMQLRSLESLEIATMRDRPVFTTHWNQLGPLMQRTLVGLFSTNAKSLKKLRLRMVGIPPEIWAEKLECLSSLNVESCPCLPEKPWPFSNHTNTGNLNSRRSSSMSSVIASPKTSESRSSSVASFNGPVIPDITEFTCRYSDHLKMLKKRYPSMFANIRHASIAVWNSQDAPGALSEFLQAAGPTLVSLDLKMSMRYTGNSESMVWVSIPPLPSLEILNLSIEYASSDSNNFNMSEEPSGLSAPLISLFAKILERCGSGTLSTVSLSALARCEKLTSSPPTEVSASLTGIDRAFAQNQSVSAKLGKVTLELVRECHEGSCDAPCTTFRKPEDWRESFPYLSTSTEVALDGNMQQILG
ncbi:hypothetical protein MD484_g7980, partial [Candolleomyces efflorescens]